MNFPQSAASLDQQLVQASDARIQTSPLVWLVSREYLLYTRSLDFRSLPGAGKCQLSKYIRTLPLVVTLTSWPVASKILFICFFWGKEEKCRNVCNILGRRLLCLGFYAHKLVTMIKCYKKITLFVHSHVVLNHCDFLLWNKQDILKKKFFFSMYVFFFLCYFIIFLLTELADIVETFFKISFRVPQRKVIFVQNDLRVSK